MSVKGTLIVIGITAFALGFLVGLLLGWNVPHLGTP